MRLVRRGILEVEFGTGEELLARLYELVRIASDDLEAFDACLVDREDECRSRRGCLPYEAIPADLPEVPGDQPPDRLVM